MADPILQPPSGSDPYRLVGHDGDEADLGPAFGLDEVVDVQDDDSETDDVTAVGPQFDPRHREQFTGMMFLGKLDDDVVVAGHRLHLTSPSVKERLEMGLVHKIYLNSMSVEPAWRIIWAAAYVREMDGVDAPEPLNPKVKGPVATRLEWLLDSVYSETFFRTLYPSILAMEEQNANLMLAVEEQGKA